MSLALLGAGNAGGGLPVSGSAAHFDASAITGLADGAAVSQWNDSSGNARHATQATAINQPVYRTGIVNGKPVVRFDGINDQLKTAGFTLNQPEHVFIVAKWAAANALRHEYAVDGMADNGGGIFQYQNAQWVFMFAGGALVGWQTFTSLAWHSYSVLFNGASSEVRADGVFDAAASGNAGANNMGGVSLGAAGVSGNNGAVDIAEVVVYPTVLSASNRQAVEGYLRTKYATP